MTALLDKAIHAAKMLAPDSQDELARIILMFADQDVPAFELSAEDELALDESAEAERLGLYASDAEVAAVWAKRRS
jgi:hypothetical protein